MCFIELLTFSGHCDRFSSEFDGSSLLLRPTSIRFEQRKRDSYSEIQSRKWCVSDGDLIQRTKGGWERWRSRRKKESRVRRNKDTREAPRKERCTASRALGSVLSNSFYSRRVVWRPRPFRLFRCSWEHVGTGETEPIKVRPSSKTVSCLCPWSGFISPKPRQDLKSFILVNSDVIVGEF